MSKSKQIKSERYQRAFTIECRADEENERTVELAFSSEEPYERFFGMEVLSHKTEDIRLDRLNGGGAVLVEHDSRDHVGVVERAWVDEDKKARAVVRFSSSARGQEILNDVRDGIRSLVSVGYRIHRYQESKKDGVTTVRATDWEPYELSIVAVPADPTVGVGRSDSDSPVTTQIKPQEIETMSEENMRAVEPKQPEAPKVGREAIANEVRTAELDRINKIEAMADEHGLAELGRSFINDGKSASDFYQAALKAIGKRNTEVMAERKEDGDIGLSQKEKGQFSLLRAMYAEANPTDKRAQEAAAFEREVSAAAVDKLGIAKRGIHVPAEVLTRDLSAGTATDGAELVADNLLAGSFIDLLRNSMSVMRAGATMLPGLVGNVEIPRQTAGSTGTWIASEGAAASESEAQFDQVTLTPKDVATYTDVTRRLLLQSTPAIEGLVRRDLATALGLAIDLAALDGSGASGQPTGISATAGINTVDLTAANPTYAEVVQIVREVLTDNALMGNLAWIIDPQAWEALMTTEKAANTAQFIYNEAAGTVLGYPAITSTQVTPQEYFFGNFSDLLVGEWGGLDLTVDPYTSSTTGTVRYVVFKTVDVAVRHAVSFCHAHDGIV